MSRLRTVSVAALLAFAVGCGGADPLAESQTSPRSAAAPAGSEASGVPAPVPVEVAPAEATPAPAEPVDLPADQLVAGPLPAELAATIRAAAGELASNERAKAFERLVDPIRSNGLSAAEIAGQVSDLGALLLESALQRALAAQPLLNDERTFVLLELSETTHLRFHLLEGTWRLSPADRPNRQTAGIGYDDAAKHAAFLLRKLGGVAAASSEDLWAESERPVVAALRKEGAGIAIGEKDGAPLCAIVLNRAFAGKDDSFARLTTIESLQILAVYETPVTDAGLKGVAELPALRHLRLDRNGFTDDVVASIGRASHLRSLRLAAFSRTPVGLAPLSALKSLEQCSLTNLGFGSEDLAALKSLPELRRLDVTDSTIDDAGLARIAEFPRIESVKIPPNVTAAGVAAVRSKVPKLFLDR